VLLLEMKIKVAKPLELNVDKELIMSLMVVVNILRQGFT